MRFILGTYVCTLESGYQITFLVDSESKRGTFEKWIHQIKPIAIARGAVAVA